MDNNIDVIIFQSKIQTLVKVSYPNVIKLINYNTFSLVQYLKTKGTVKLRLGQFRFKVKSRTWSEIIKYFEDAEDDKRLENARVILAKKIYNKHYKIQSTGLRLLIR
ncbi:unnamed protein product [Rhizophagus irregularis]|nr:unnamed protein product [Rhizophagus irregularis]CAB5377835.1 unnamed protein product [Rhizophagus irregularis]